MKYYLRLFRSVLILNLTSLTGIFQLEHTFAYGDEKQPSTTIAETPKAETQKKEEPFAFADFSWLNGNNRQKDTPSLFKNDYLTVSLYLDTYYNYSWNRPIDHTITGSATIGRDNEFQINLASIEFEANYKNAIGRLALQTGSTLSIIQDTDPTVNRGRNLNVNNLKYIREAAVGYHWDSMYGINLEAGIFPSYLGLDSYLTQENWSYQRSLVSDFTPFYFHGLRLQIFPRKDLKIEPWVINGFQTYGKFNESNALGVSIVYRPIEVFSTVANFYYGADIQQNPDARRFHHDDSFLLRYWNAPQSQLFSKAACSINNHYGFENGGGLDSSKNFILGTAIANRIWFAKNLFALTLRGSFLTNPGRYLVPPVSAVSNTTTTANVSYQSPGTDFRAWDYTATLDYMPNEVLTLRAEVTDRHATVPFYAGASGTTNANNGWGLPDPSFTPDLNTSETRATLAASFRM